MNIYIRFIIIIFYCLMAVGIYAQEIAIANPPITIEPFIGNRALAYQMIINKKIQSAPRFGFLGITNFQAEWDTPIINDYTLQGNVTYNLGGGFDLNAGFIWVPEDGIRPTTGFMYTYVNPEFLLITNPRVDIAKNPNTDILLLVEYRPRINSNLQLYTRAQGLYGYNFYSKSHTRSYLMIRAGITFKDFTLGIANDIDYFGPEKLRLNNFGGFIMVELF